MPYALLPVPINLVTILIYWWARTRNNLKLVAVIQPLNTALSITIIALGFFGGVRHPNFSLWMIAGMALALVGDINNVNMADDRIMIRGLVIFLLAYLTYAIGLTVINGFHVQDILIGSVLLVAFAAGMAYLWPGLGAWKGPVLVYSLLMQFLVSRAISTFFGDVFGTAQAILLSVGTIGFYLGDLEYGIQRFRTSPKFRFGPLLYAGGQLLVALATLG